jgi:hypothetical protein
MVDTYRAKADAGAMSLLRWLRYRLLGAQSGESSPSGARMSEDEARRIAESWAAANKKYWMMPATAAVKVDQGRRIWLVQSNAHGKGHGVLVVIDDATGQIVEHHESLR